MKAIKGTAIYTGGGQYSVIGELDNGLWFNGCNDFCEIYNDDVKTVSRYDSDDLAIFCDDEWIQEHNVTSQFDYKEVIAMFKDFCERLDNKEKGLTDGYEAYSNYLPGEVTRMINFSYFEGL